MIRKSIQLFLASALLVAAFPALATNGIRLIGFGPIQNSMGGVGVGATLDAASMVTNPAGLTDLEPRLDVGLTLIKPTADYRAAESPLPPPYTGAVVASPDQIIGSNRGPSPIPSIGLVRPLDDRLTAGIGLYGVSGLGVDYPANLYGGGTYISYLVGRLTPSIAYRVDEHLSAGVTLNCMLAQLAYNVAAGIGQQPHDTATSLGIGATFGVRLTPVKAVSLGLAYETRSWFQDFKYDIPAHQAVNPADFSIVQLPGGQDRLNFDLPSNFTAGFSVKPFEMLLVAADVQYIRWSETHGKSMPQYSSGPATTGSMPLDLNWSDQVVFKLGAELAAWRTVRIRAGYNYGKSPLDPNRAFENIAVPAIAEHHITFGLGMSISPSLAVNLASTYSPKASITGSNAAYPAQGGQAIAYYVPSMSQYSLEAGLAYHY